MPNNKNITILKNPLAVKSVVDMFTSGSSLVKVGSFEVECRLRPASKDFKTKKITYFLDKDHVKEIEDSVGVGSQCRTGNFRRDGAVYYYITRIIMPIEEEVAVGVAVPKSEAQIEVERIMRVFSNIAYLIVKQ